MTFDTSPTNALHRLLTEATRPRTNGEFDRFHQPMGDSELAAPQSQLEELREQAQMAIAVFDDPFRLGSQLLAYVSSQFRTVELLHGLVATLSPTPRLPSSSSVRLLSLCQFSQCGIEVDVSNAPFVIAYAEILESLVTSQTPFNSHVYTSLQLQFVRLMNDPPRWLSQLLPVYSLLLVSESKRSGSDLIALDLFSEALEAVKEYSVACDVAATLDSVFRLLTEALQREHDAIECLQAIVQLQPKSSQLRELSPAECESLLMQLLSASSLGQSELTTTVRWFRQLAIRDEHRAYAKILLNGCDLARGRHQKYFVAELGQLLENAVESGVAPFRIQYLLSAFERGEILQASDFLKSIERVTDLKQVENLSTYRVLTASAVGHVDRLRLSESSQFVSPELLRMRLDHWEELNSIHRGFTSRLISTKRGPFREPPDLVQFAIDVGSEKSVRYINAKDPNLFPGKGFFITRLKLARCFATSQVVRAEDGHDPFAIYKKAWPVLAEAMDDFDDAEFVFLRGCLLISCKRRDYLLPSGKGEHYSLIVFNDHFRNPFQEVAYLVPNEGVAKLLLGTQIPYSDFVGFDQRRPDLNEHLHSPQSFLEHPLIREKAIDVGGVSAILSGFEIHLVRIGQLVGLSQLRMPTEELGRRTEDHNRSILDWERQSHRFHQSEAGQKQMMELSDVGKGLEVELNRLNQLRSNIFGDVEDKIWRLVDKYTNLHKLFCIAHAYWHRGYTAGRVIATHHIDESSQENNFVDDVGLSQDQLRLEDGLEAVANRNSIRMLVQAYEWHAMREAPHAKKEDFPILVLCDALQLGARPEMDLYIDTFDMSAFIKGQRIFLSHGKMSGDDELYWFNTIVPRIQDSAGVIRDLRFYPRASLGMVDSVYG